MRELERRVLLSVLDRKWREHLYEMDYLREGIGLRAYSQRDPLVEYQREGFDLFSAMMDSIKEESVGYLFNVEVSIEPEAADGQDAAEHWSQARSPTAGDPRGCACTSTTTTARTSWPRVSRHRRLRRSSRTRRRRSTGTRAPTSRPRRPRTSSRASRATTRARADPGKKFKRCHGDPANRAKLS